MEAGRQQRVRDPATAITLSDDVRTLLAATMSDVCASAHVSFCSLSRVHGDEAVIVATQGADCAPLPGSRWRVADTPPARQAVTTARAVVLTSRDDPRLTREQRTSLAGDVDLASLMFVPLLARSGATGLLILGDLRPKDLSQTLPQLASVARLLAVVLEQDDRLAMLARSADDLALVLDADIEAQSRSTGPDQVLRVVARRLSELCHAPMVDIHAVDGERLRPMVSWQHGRFKPDYEGSMIALADWPLTRAVVATGRPEVVESLEDPRLGPEQVAGLRRWRAESVLSIPLLSNGRVIGVAEVFDTVPRDFAEVARPARALGEIAAHLLDKALLLEALEQRNRSLREIVRLGAHVNETGDPVEMAGYVARRLLEVLGATCCEIYKIERDELRCLASLDTRPGFDDPDADAPAPLRDFPSLGRAAQDQDLLVFASPDDPRLTEYEREMLDRWGFASELSIPLLIEGRLVGLIDVFDVRSRTYAEHLDFARSVGQLIAGAFDNLLLLERLAHTNQELRVLADSSLEFGASLDLDKVLGSVASRMCLAAEADCCDIYAIEAETLRGLVSTDGGKTDEAFPGTSYPLADYAISRRAVEVGQPVAVTDIAGDPRLTTEERTEDMRFGFASLLALPLINRGAVVGIAVVYDRKQREFAHLDLLRGLGQIAAQAIANASVHAALDAGTERLEQINEASLDLAASLDLGRVLEATARRLCRVAAVDSCDVYTLHGRELRCEASILHGSIDEDWVHRTYSVDAWRASRLAIESRTVVSVVSLDDRRLSPEERLDMERYGQKSALIVPLMVEQRVIGIAEVFETERERAFTAAEIATVDAVCRVAGLAIVNAELFHDAELRSRESELLNQIAIKVGSSLDTGTIAAATVTELATLVPFTEAWLTMAVDGGPWEVAYASSPTLGDAAEGLVSQQAVLDTVRRDRVARVDLHEAAASGPLGPTPDLRWLLTIGIFIDEALAGVLTLASGEADAFAGADRPLLERVGALLALSFKNARLYETIKTMHVANLKALISALNARDYYAVGHAARVAAYMLLLGRELGWPADRLQQITEAAFLHDVGRIGISDDLLYKPGRLSEQETAELRRHPVASAEIVQPLFAADLVRAVRHHHERWDGAGYPDGLTGESTPEVARALCIVDSYDAMSFQRPHHEALSYAECLAELERCRGGQFDPVMVAAFMRVLDRMDERRTIAREAAEAAASRVDAVALVALSTLGDETRPEYARMAETLREVRDAYPGVRFLTTMVPGRDGLEMVCDPEEDLALRSHLGDPVDRSAVGGDSATVEAERNVLQLDDFGIWICGVADVHDAGGTPVGLTCADLAPADDWPAELGVSGGSHDRTLSAIVESATARLGRARVDAVTDGLTGLYNQRYFKQRLGEEVARATEQGHALSLLFCDLDHFKGYNDRLGHVAGDRALRAVASVVLRSIRQVDLAARYGGEEITVILIDTPADAAIEVADRIRLGVAELDLGGPDHSITVSIGTAAYPEDATLMEELLDKSDWAMYLAKRQGRNRVVPFRGGAADGAPASHPGH